MVKLNLGCKQRKLAGFDNLDKIFGWTFQEGLPKYANGSVEAITISHALMFLNEDELRKFISEMERVLRVGGIVRITEDDCENPKSAWYKTGNLRSGPSCLTGPKMMRKFLEEAGFMVFDLDKDTTRYFNKSLIQAYRGGAPNVFFIEGVKKAKNLEEGIKVRGQGVEIPNASREDLPQFFVERGYRVGAEIGVWKGAFSESFCKAGLKLYAIDPWLVYKGFENPKGQGRMDFLYEHTGRVLAPYPNATIVRKTSLDALHDFPDGSLDFVYIDANHDFRYIAEDLFEWTKKVKPGGIVAGHDVQFVGPVIRAYSIVYGIPNWYILGRNEKINGEIRDRWLSWMFIV